ncbi:hypothetical protein HMPREF9413_1335 [Paenibacillus sp. HGF7]|nr:hypothetical protein HMPREF9413_1335 [Paenibacillus sp. HGF7]
MFQAKLQPLLLKEEVESVVEWIGCQDKARTFSVYTLL